MTGWLQPTAVDYIRRGLLPQPVEAGLTEETFT